jgi:hypothetical protein
VKMNILRGKVANWWDEELLVALHRRSCGAFSLGRSCLCDHMKCDHFQEARRHRYHAYILSVGKNKIVFRI